MRQFRKILTVNFPSQKPSFRLFQHNSLYSNSGLQQHHTLLLLVEKCSSMSQVKVYHAQIILRGLAHDLTSLSHLISFCALSPSGNLQYAHKLFDKIPHPNRHMYNTLIRACSGGKYSGKAFFLYRKMMCRGILPNEFTFPFVLKASAALEAYADGVSVHSQAVKLGFHESYVVVSNGLINFYVSCGRVECARKMFDSVRYRTSVTWNSIIGGYAKLGFWKEAFMLFGEMWEGGVGPDGHTFVSLLSVCSRVHDVDLGRYVHWCIEINGFFPDVYLQNALLDMYAKCGYLQMAEAVFARILDKNVVSWTSMISSYAKHGLVELAERIFERMPVKNVVSWNSMISCYLQNGYYKESLNLFYTMSDSRVIADETTLVSALSACGHLGDLVSGKKLHDYLCDNSMQFTVRLCNSLVDMYAKCGSAESALNVFRGIREKNIISWNTITNSLALHGFGHRAIMLFQEMEAGGMRPDALTFLGLLSACCHCGLIEIGRYYFTKMGCVYNIPYQVEHYASMIDMLGRGGFLNEALELVGTMEMRPDGVIWGTLLGACRIHGNVVIAKVVLKQVLELEKGASGLYVLMSNIFSEARKWDEAKKMRKLMNDRFVRKTDAVSSIEVDGCISSFMADDKKHESSNRVCLLLEQMKVHLERVNDIHGLSEELLWCC